MSEDTNLEELQASAEEASNFLKAIANPHRLVVLCLLAEKEMNVSELEKKLKMRQPALSQQLARLREEGFVETRRSGKSVYYRLANKQALDLIQYLHQLFCTIPA